MSGGVVDDGGSWIGVDLDGVLAVWDQKDFPEIGPPIEGMVTRVKEWLAEGVDVRIFTARVAVIDGLTSEYGEADVEFAADQKTKIDRWCEQQFGRRLPVTATKDFKMVAMYDDRCVQMITNKGIALADQVACWARELLQLTEY